MLRVTIAVGIVKLSQPWRILIFIRNITLFVLFFCIVAMN